MRRHLEIEPFTRTDDVFQLGGGMLNLVVTAPAVVLLASYRETLVAHPLFALAGIVLGTFAADFVSGLLHWAFDTYFSERNTFMKRTVLIVREHHIFPNHIFHYSAWREAGTVSWFAALGSAPAYALAAFVPELAAPARVALLVAGLTFSLELTFMLEFHKAGHRAERGALVRALQKMRLLLSPEHHLRHHAGRHDFNYCLINGVADLTLGKLGAFRAMEAVIAAATGAVAREHDRELLAEFGRPRG